MKYIAITIALFLPIFSRAALVYTTESSFTAVLASGYYLEGFSSLTAGSFTPTFSGSGGAGPFAYTIRADPSGTDLYVASGPALPNGNALQSAAGSKDLLIAFTSGNVTAVGGKFFLANFAGDNLTADTLRVTLNDGTSVDFASPASGSVEFRGFTTDTDHFITSLLIHRDSSGFAALDDLYVGEVTPVPEGSTAITAGLLCLFAVTRLFTGRRARSSSKCS